MELTTLTKQIVDDFNEVINQKWEPSSSVINELNKLTMDIKEGFVRSKELRRKELLKLINKKFDFNKDTYRTLINSCAKLKVYFNFQEKLFIQDCINGNDIKALNDYFTYRLEEHYDVVQKYITPLNEENTLNLLSNEIEKTPNKQQDILEAIFGGYVFISFDKKVIHNYFSGKNIDEDYRGDYYEFLKTDFPDFFNEHTSLVYLYVDENLFKSYNSLLDFKNAMLNSIKNSYKNLDNHSYFAIHIKPIYNEELNIQWDLYGDIVLYAEKFKETHIDRAYFKPQKIQEITHNYIENLDLKKANFNVANEGFSYVDTFVLLDSNSDNPDNGNYDLLLLFEKNERDERAVPCPACRSLEVQGNSYPKLNVKSWECINAFCPDRSKYNRGKRYSLQSLIRQEAIEKEENQIPTDHIRKWRLDIVKISNQLEVIEMLIRHYSLHGDNITIINWTPQLKTNYGRNIKYIPFSNVDTSNKNVLKEFYNSSFFHRFLIDKDNSQETHYENLANNSNFRVFCGDAYSVLSTIEDNSIDGAVTSPPYYNAREYSQWDNIYTYLYDMYNIAKQVYRVLKEGGVYLFNIFDYFDNENNIVFSAMGKKRMILGAYTIHLFKKAGFTVNNNIIWDKGEIEGKRNHNNGNLSPYYQAPFNAWEHIFIFSKGKMNENYNFPALLNAKPVVKMIKKKNILGHTAPFPKEIPELLIKNMKQGETILDPFAGSFTTGRYAFSHKIKSVNIDYKVEYCKLGIKLFEKELNAHQSNMEQMKLF